MTDVGERLGPFLMIERIGRGGMGEVWLAQPVAIPSVRDLCVVKTVRAEVADDADALRRFADETRLAMLLHHPHISRVVDAGRAGTTRYLALGLVEGVDLLTLMRRLAARGAPLDESVALWILACALDALAFAHAARHPLSGEPLGVVHRDISPQNIMCARSGNAHVIDFGLALSSVKQARTEQDIVLGKLAYMAPEQARGNAVDARADIYALGVVLYELVAGARYWGELEHPAIWKLAGREDWTPPHFADLPRDIAAVLGPMIARVPDARANDAAERLEALTPLLIARGGPAAAVARLAQLVEDNAAPELERVARARATMMSLPDDAPTEGLLDPNTQSLALDEAAAIAAALASPTIAMTAIAMPAFTAPGASPRTLPAQTRETARIDRSVGGGPRTLVDALPGPIDAPVAAPGRGRRRLALAAGALALAAMGGLALSAALTGAPAIDAVGGDAGIPGVAADAGARALADAGVIASVVVVTARIDAGVDGGVDAGVDATAIPDTSPEKPRPRKRTLDERLRALSQCNERCAVTLRKGQDIGPLEAASGPGRVAIEATLRNCELSCRRPR